MIKVLVCGAMGKMGQAVVDAVTEAQGMQLVAAVDINQVGEPLGCDSSILVEDSLVDAIKAHKPDVMVDFTNPTVVFNNVMCALDYGVRPVIGATGLSEEQKSEIDQKIKAKKMGGLVAANFAIGAILMMEFSKQAAKYLPDVEIIEYHHDNKLDAPSGTSLTTAKAIASVRAPHKQGHPEEEETLTGARGGSYEGIPIHSVRLAGRVAHQEVIFGGIGQILTIRHDSIDRASFMPGVVLAIEAVMEKDCLVDGLDKVM